MWVIHGRKEMVEQIGADNSVDLFHTEVFRELAQWKHCNGQVLDGPVADGERVDPPLLDIGVLAAGKNALDRPESRHAKLPAEVGIESHLRTAGIDEEGDFVAAVYAHADHRQRIGF